MKQAIALLAALATLNSASAVTTFLALADNGIDQRLFQFADSPATVGSGIAITGTSGFLSDIAFDPASGILYGLNFRNRILYSVNSTTGVATEIANGLSVGATSGGFAADFGYSVSILDAFGGNSAVIVGNGLQFAFPGASYLAGTGLLSPDIAGLAVYGPTNDYFAIDAQNDKLAAFDPNTGDLYEIGSLGVDAPGESGFEIVGGIGYLAFDDGFESAMYSVNLTTGSASKVAAFPSNQYFTTGLSIPEPSSFVLVMAGGCLFFRRRR